MLYEAYLMKLFMFQLKKEGDNPPHPSTLIPLIL